MEDIIVKYFETTGMCNYRCPICVGHLRNHHMDMDEFYAIANSNHTMFNKKGVWLDFNGEPLVDPYFFERVKYLKAKGVKIRISTNGSLLDDNKCIDLIMSGIDYVVVSIATLDRNTYKKIRGVDNFDLVLSNLLRLKEYINLTKSSIELQAVMIDTCDGCDRNEFINYFHEKDIHVAFHNFTNRARTVGLDLSTSYMHDYSITRGVCKGLRKNICILSNCEVITCCCDFYGRNSLGNLRDYDYSVETLLHNGKLEQLENNLSNHIYLGACEKCSDWIYYQENTEKEYVTVYPVR